MSFIFYFFVQQPVVNSDQQSINLVQQQQQWQPPQNSTVLQQQSPHHYAVGMQQYPHQQVLNPVNFDKEESLKQLIVETRKLANEYLQQEEYSIYEFLEFVNDKKAEYGFSRDFDSPKIEKILKKVDEVKLIEQNARAQRAKISNSSVADGIDSFNELSFLFYGILKLCITNLIAVNSGDVGYGLDDSDDEIFDAFSSFGGLPLPLMLLPESFEDYLNVANGIQPNNNHDFSLQNNFYLAAIRYLDLYAEYGQLKLNEMRRNFHNYGNHQIRPRR